MWEEDPEVHPKPAQAWHRVACDRWRGIRCVPPALSQKGLRHDSTPAGSYLKRTLVNQGEQCNLELGKSIIWTQLMRVDAEDRAQRRLFDY